MIYRLRKKFILISASSILIVFTAIFSVMCLVSFLQLNRTMDPVSYTHLDVYKRQGQGTVDSGTSSVLLFSAGVYGSAADGQERCV